MDRHTDYYGEYSRFRPHEGRMSPPAGPRIHMPPRRMPTTPPGCSIPQRGPSMNYGLQQVQKQRLPRSQTFSPSPSHHKMGSWDVGMNHQQISQMQAPPIIDRPPSFESPTSAGMGMIAAGRGKGKNVKDKNGGGFLGGLFGGGKKGKDKRAKSLEAPPANRPLTQGEYKKMVNNPTGGGRGNMMSEIRGFDQHKLSEQVTVLKGNKGCEGYALDDNGNRVINRDEKTKVVDLRTKRGGARVGAVGIPGLPF